MYGFPKIIKTRHDVDVLMGYLGSGWATPDNIARGLNILRSLKNDKVYVFDRDLGESEQPDGEAPDYLVMEDEETGTRRQLRLQPDSGALIRRLGLTKTEVDHMITTIENA